jgi:hypothetical protein
LHNGAHYTRLGISGIGGVLHRYVLGRAGELVEFSTGMLRVGLKISEVLHRYAQGRAEDIRYWWSSL